ncbi:MAG: PEP-CTERM sorting domain-containing protein [Akkermansia sp.]|nr:PEP-CTERM sorting domain-containing protein [Akkermansia sp.]
MKKTLIALFALAGMASAATTLQYVDPTSTTSTATAGSTYGSITLNEDMAFGTFSAWNGQFGATPEVNITGGQFYAGDYTLSLWLDTTSLADSGETLLFAYSGSTASNSHGYNAIVWDATNSQLKIGRGNFTAADMSVAWQENSTLSVEDPQDGITNITFAVTGANQSQTATVYINGVDTGTMAAYNGNMNGGNANSTMKYHVNTNVTYGTIGLTNEKLTSADAVMAFANPAAVPEPATASLSLLGLAALMIRRRR